MKVDRVFYLLFAILPLLIGCEGIGESLSGNGSNEVEVIGITLDKTSLTLIKGSGEKLTANVWPVNATTNKVLWKSSNPSVATVMDGIVIANGIGKATITAQAGKQKASCLVEVIVFQLEAVDLGLSVKWANMNLGASSPEGFGDYYAWGETKTKKTYTLDNYKYWKPSENYIWGLYTKYVIDKSFGTIDNKTTLDLEDDVAHVKLGGKWRMPTKEEIEELLSQCNRDRWAMKAGQQNEDGIKGLKATSKKNGKWIFFPAGGALEWDIHSGIDSFEPQGLYWSSTLQKNEYETNNTQVAYVLYFGYGNFQLRGSGRSTGLPIRPVMDY